MTLLMQRSRPGQSSELDFKYSFHRYRKLRFYVTWIFAVVLAVYARSSNRGFLLGVPIAILGEMVRIWAQGYLRKSRRLATDGPYAYVRNPLYLGNFLIGAGFCIAIWHPILFGVYVIGFFAAYWFTIKAEEQRLLDKFNGAYRDYCLKVSRFLPRLRPYEHCERAKFAWHRIWGHGEHITILATITLFLILYLRQLVFQERKLLSLEVAISSLIAIVLGALLFLAFQRRRLKGNIQRKN